MERDLREALRAGDRELVQALRAEARRRFAGMLGLPRELDHPRPAAGTGFKA